MGFSDVAYRSFIPIIGMLTSRKYAFSLLCLQHRMFWRATRAAGRQRRASSTAQSMSAVAAIGGAAKANSLGLRQMTRLRQATRRRVTRSSRTIRHGLGEVGGAVAEGNDDALFSPSHVAADPSGKRALAARRRARPWYIIDPRSSKWIAVWDTLTMVALIWTALVTPYEVALLEAPTTTALALADPLFIINRVIDTIFIIDMVVQMFTMVQVFDDRKHPSGLNPCRSLLLCC